MPCLFFALLQPKSTWPYPKPTADKNKLFSCEALQELIIVIYVYLLIFLGLSLQSFLMINWLDC